MKVNAKVTCSSSLVPSFGPGENIEITPPTDAVQKALFEGELARWKQAGAVEVVSEADAPPKTKAELNAERAAERAEARQEEADERKAEDRAASKKNR